MSFNSLPIPPVIDSFTDRFFFLSNFYEAIVIYEGQQYPSSEHAYQAAKTLNKDERRKVAGCPTPGRSKTMGRRVTLRHNWDDIKYGIMKDIVRIKFTSHDELRHKLLQTGNSKLIEGNTWHDNYFGSCICLECGNRGKNALGQILMEIRDELQSNGTPG